MREAEQFAKTGRTWTSFRRELGLYKKSPLSSQDILAKIFGESYVPSKRKKSGTSKVSSEKPSPEASSQGYLDSHS